MQRLRAAALSGRTARRARRIADHGGWVALAAGLAALACHASYVALGFVWLDHGDLVQGRALIPLADPLRAFRETFAASGFYRPLMTLSLSLDHAVGPDPRVFHATNVLLHALLAAAVPWFARVYFGVSARASLVVGLVFAVHPLSWLPVGAIAYRSEILAGGFSLGAVACWIRQARGEGGLAPFALLFAAALLSKESALWWVLALCGLALWARGLPRERALGSGLAALAGVPLAWLLLRAVFGLGGWPAAHHDLSAAHHVLVRLAALGLRSLDLAGVRLPPLGDGVRADESGLVVLGALALGVGLASIVLARRSLPALALAFVAVVAAPALHIVPAPRFASAHYWYLAPIGLGVLAGWLLGEGGSRPRLALLCAWLLLLASVTFRGGPRFRDDVALFAPAVERRAGFCEGWQYLGLHAWTRQPPAPEQARRYFERALACRWSDVAFVDEPMARFNLAAIAGSEGRYEEARAQLDAIRGREPPGLEAAAERMRAALPGPRGSR